MTEDKQTFLDAVAKALATMAKMLKYAPKEIDGALINDWCRVLYTAKVTVAGHRRYVTAADLTAGADEWMRVEREFPTPSDLLEIIEETGQ